MRMDLFGAIALLATSMPLCADDAKPAATTPRVTVIVGATVLPVRGAPIRRGTVIWKDGKIVAVGPELAVPDGAEVIDGTGRYVCPGFVAVLTSSVGVSRTQGDVASSLDPYGQALRIVLSNGITTVQVYDQNFAGLFGTEAALAAGSNSAVIKLTHGDLAGMLIREPALNYFSLPTRQLEVNYYELRDRFRRAKEFIAKRAQAREKKEKEPAMDRDLGPYVTVLENERPTVFSPRSNEEIETILDLRARYGFDVVLNEPNEAWQIAPRLAAARVPVLVKSRGRDFDFSSSGPTLEEGDMAPVRRPAAFARAGVDVTILPYRRGVDTGGIAGRDLSTLAMDAAFAVRGGLSENEALAAITIAPARVLRVDDRVGTLEAGKDADVLITSGHPLDYRSWVLQAFINGKLYYDRSSSRLYRRVPLHEEK